MRQRERVSVFCDVSDALVQYQKVREIRAERELLVAALQDRKRLAYLTYRGGVDTLLNALDVDRDLFDVAGCFLGYHGRTRLVRAAGTRDIHIAVLEDILAIGGSLWAVSRF